MSVQDHSKHPNTGWKSDEDHSKHPNTGSEE